MNAAEQKQQVHFGTRDSYKDDHKSTAAQQQQQQWTNPPPPVSEFPITGIQSSFDAFFSNSATQGQQQQQQTQQEGGVGGGMQSPADSTLPHFDTFGSFMAPAAQTYKTPFDSPDPVIGGGVEAAEPAAVDEPVVGGDLAEEEIRPRPQRTASMPVQHVAFDADSIFHTTKASPRTHERSKPKKKKAAPAAVDTGAAQSAEGQPEHKRESSLPDVVFSGVIPEIVSSSALLSRRASEPTLGSRRAAEAARLAAAEAAAANAAKSSAHDPSAKPAGVPRRLSIKTETLDTAKASNINLDPLSLASPVTPHRCCSQCSAPAFASDYCATHLTQHMEPATPTSIIRRVHGLWSKQIEQTATGSSSSRIRITWRFWKRAEHYVITLSVSTCARVGVGLHARRELPDGMEGVVSALRCLISYLSVYFS